VVTFSGNELIFRRERLCELGTAQFGADALGPGQLLVQTCYSLVSQGTEAANFTGLDPGTRQPGSWNCYPHRPGYAAIGTVAAAGSNADGAPEFAVGDLVFAITKHASYGLADSGARPVVKLSTDDDLRTLILCRMAAIAMTGLRKSGSADLGGRAIVVGLGLVGFFAAQLLRLSGMDVLGVDAADVRRTAAAAAGLRVTPAQGIGEARPLGVRRAEGPDLVIEASGSPAGLRLALELVRDGGEVVLLGTPRGGSTSDPTELMAAIHYRGLRLVGALEWLLPLRSRAWAARWSLYDSYHTVIGLFRSGALRLGGWQVRTARPADAQAVYSELADGPSRAHAVLFDWAHCDRIRHK
jgi:2-desacetyl-2-hydroxyethyl bacteriochlorophyllide A dehydrogenase